MFKMKSRKGYLPEANNYYKDIRSWCMVQNVGQLERRRRENCTQLKCAEVGKRNDETRSCKKCRHLIRGTCMCLHNGGIPQREEVEMVWTCAKAR